MIDHGVNGVLASTVSAEGLADALLAADEMEFDREQIRANAISAYAPTKIAAEYLDVYASLLS